MKKKLLLLSLLATVTIAFCGVFSLSGRVSAAGGQFGSGSGPTGGTCAPKGWTGVYNDTCFGATWRYHTADSDSIKVRGTSAAPGITVENCKTYGGGYYVLGLEAYYPSKLRAGKTPEQASAGYHLGVTKVGKIKSGGNAGDGAGSYSGGAKATFLVFNGTESWNKVFQQFTAAQNYAKEHPEFQGNLKDANWEDVTYFCWNKDNPPQESKESDSSFDAWSFVGESFSSYTGTNSPDSYVEKNFVTKNEKYIVYFQHQMRYNRPTVPGTYDPAKTNWRTEVTVDGQLRSDKSIQATPLSVTNSGPGGAPIWIEPTVGRQAVEVTVPENGSVRVCSKIYYQPKNIKWKEESGRFIVDTAASSGDGSSEACAIVSREPVTPPNQESEDGGKIRFVSRSGVRANSPIAERRAVSNDTGNDTVELYISTLKDSVDVRFWHDMRYFHESEDGIIIQIPPDEFEDADYIKSNWTVTRSSDDRANANGQIANGTLQYSASGSQASGIPFQKVNGENVYTIRGIQVGETVEVCEEIKFEPEYFPLERINVRRHDPAYTAASTYQGLTMYTRKENPGYNAETNLLPDNVSGGRYLYESATIYHSEWVESTCQEGMKDGYWDWCATGEPAHIEYKSGGKIGQTAYVKTGNEGEKPYQNDSNFDSSNLYINDFQAVSSYEEQENVINKLGYYTRKEQQTPDGITYYTYNKVTPVVQDKWVEPQCARWNSEWGYCEEYKCLNWQDDGWGGYCAEYDSGHWSYRAYDPAKDKGAVIYAPNGETLYEPQYELVHDHWKFRPIKGAEGGEGYSKACISVTRPEDPYSPGTTDPEGNPVSGPVSGNPESGFIYAGETGDRVEWSTAATSYATRRVMQAQAIVYEPKVTLDVRGRDDISKGNLGISDINNNHIDTCQWYTNKIQAGNLRDRCVTIDVNGKTGNYWPYGYGGSYNSESPTKLHNITGETVSVIIPDYVGDKYCNSFGYELAYWWGVTHTNPESNHWEQEGQSFWAIYDAACRTIAKKPTMNIWNGSLFANGDVTTSVANRYLSPVLGGTTSNPLGSGQRRYFGSWSEYLAVVGGKVGGGRLTGGFGSGTSLSYTGLLSVGNLLERISPLTISNATPCAYGNSGIAPNSTYRARLITYLKNLTSNDKTIVINAGGDYTISDNITLSDGPYNSVFELPQIIIFADNINIAPEVTRIDAWLIAENEINTCAEFVRGSNGGDPGTEAHIKGYNDRNQPVCSQKLTVNGPIVSKTISLNRSYGADPITDKMSDPGNDVLGSGTDDRAIPGEAFNLSADAYLWAYAQAGRYNSSYTEAYARELPPRY